VEAAGPHGEVQDRGPVRPVQPQEAPADDATAAEVEALAQDLEGRVPGWEDYEYDPYEGGGAGDSDAEVGVAPRA
jgi:hypothetical protein